MAKTKFCHGISDISDSYMGFIIDGWGVLHDGENLFPGVVDCMKELKERKKTIIILANALQRADEYKAFLKKMGLGPSLYSKIITPAQSLYENLKEQDSGVFEGLGNKCYVFSRGGDTSLLNDTNVTAVSNMDEADFVLISGSDYPRLTLADYESLIQHAIQKRLKAFCPYPDSLSAFGGNILMGPTLLARRYEDSGGIVHYIGKPYELIYRECIEFFQSKDVFPSHTVMLGDTMAHDVLGAHAAGIDTCLFKSGLHAANFAHCETQRDVNNALKNLISVYNNVMPLYLVDEMKWGKALPDRKHKRRKQPAT